MTHWMLTILYDLGKSLCLAITVHWLIEHGLRWLENALKRTEKRIAIMEHMLAKVLKEGHDLALGKCRDGKCSVIAG